MKQALLLPNIEGFPSESMRRYASELTRSLKEIDDPEWRISSLTCGPSQRVARALGNQMASRHARFVRYPSLIRSHERADVYHVLDHSHADLAMSTPPARSILTCHDVIPLLAARGKVPIPVPWPVRYTFPLRVRCMARCARIIAISESTKRTLVNDAGLSADAIRVVYNGVNPYFRPEASGIDRDSERAKLVAKLQLPASARVLLHVSTPMRYKNTPAILRALAQLVKSVPDVCLVRVGADLFSDEWTLARELGIAGAIHCVGRVQDDSVLAAYYRAADVFVFPSLWEGFGWPVLEAMACGTAVVTSNVASLPEVVGDAGITVDPADHLALAGGIKALLDNPAALNTRRQQCLEQARKFTWGSCARNTLDVYREVAG